MPDTPIPPSADPELPTVHEQLIVFARELGDLYRLERARTAELEHALESLRKTYLATMRALALVIEAKDTTTRGHLDRTQAYGIALARKIDPTLVRSPTLGYGFFLHDIGKVGVPEAILCKEGPLTGEEWNVMRSHPIVGADIVAPMGFLAETVDLIRHHHERFDGSGYPDGLAGDAIPVESAIVSCCDAFNAMTTDRSYRAAMSLDEALAEVRANSGTQFAPAVVDALVKVLREDPLAAGARAPRAVAA